MAVSEPTPNPFDLFLDRIREIVREEIKAAANRNGHEPKLLYNTKEAAELCGVPESWLAAAARGGKVKCRHLGSYVRFSMEDLRELIEKSGGDT
jgi:Helix-turn-helix domain